jgi:hypothetical protein
MESAARDGLFQGGRCILLPQEAFLILGKNEPGVGIFPSTPRDIADLNRVPGGSEPHVKLGLHTLSHPLAAPGQESFRRSHHFHWTASRRLRPRQTTASTESVEISDEMLRDLREVLL